MNENPLSSLYKEMKTLGFLKGKSLFLDYCLQLVSLREKGDLSEQEVGYWIVAGLLTEDLSSEFEDIFDAAGDLEIPRESSFKQKTGEWNKDIADKIKDKEWKNLVQLLKDAQEIA